MKNTLKYIKNIIKDFKPEIGIILGSGLGSFADKYRGISIPYAQIPGFEKPRVEGHKGQLVFARAEGKNLVIMQGRYHYYEGYPIQTIVYPVKVLKMLGIKTLVITNAAGAVNKNFKPGGLMFLTDHINLMGVNPLTGRNDDTFGVRFPDMSEIYSKELIEKCEKTAKSLNIQTYRGVYAASSGPSYETPAEVNMLGILGADAAGMSSVPEAITAKWCGLNIIGISCITNYASGVSDTPLSHSEVIETAGKTADIFQNLLSELIKVL